MQITFKTLDGLKFTEECPTISSIFRDAVIFRPILSIPGICMQPHYHANPNIEVHWRRYECIDVDNAIFIEAPFVKVL